MNKNSIYTTIALLILLGAAGLAVFYAYLTKTEADARKTKTFDPLVVDSQGGDAFSNGSGGTGGGDTKTPQDGFGIKDTDTNKDTTGQKTETKSDGETKPVENTQPKLERIYDAPVAGFAITGKSHDYTVRLTERTRGNIIDIDTKTLKATRVTNTTVPGVIESYFNTDGTQVLLRYLDEDDAILTLGSPVSELKEKEEGKTDIADAAVGSYLPINIRSVAVFGDEVAYTTASDDGSTQLILTDFTGAKPRRIFKSPLSGWQMSWPQKSFLVVTQNASAKVPGYSYTVDAKTGSLKKIIGDARALTVNFSRFAPQYIMSTNDDSGSLVTYIRTPGKKDSFLFKKPTLPEKCDFVSISQTICGFSTNSKDLPDAWYRGEILLSDIIGSIDMKTGIETDIIDTAKASTHGLDITSLKMTSDGEKGFFIDKTSGTLWMLTLPTVESSI